MGECPARIFTGPFQPEDRSGYRDQPVAGDAGFIPGEIRDVERFAERNPGLGAAPLGRRGFGESGAGEQSHDHDPIDIPPDKEAGKRFLRTAEIFVPPGGPGLIHRRGKKV